MNQVFWTEPRTLHGVSHIPLPGILTQPRDDARVDFGLPYFVSGAENALAETALGLSLAMLASPMLAEQAAEPNGDVELNRLAATPIDARFFAPLPWPLVLSGPNGCGKTHLALGLVEQWRARFGPRTARFVTAVDFVRRHSEADDWAARDAIRESFRSVSLLVIDDLDQMPRRVAVQAELQNTLDDLDERGGYAVITSNEPPGRLKNLRPAIVSRLSQGLVIPLSAPSRAARVEMASAFAKARGLTLTDAELDFAAGGHESSPRNVLGRIATVLQQRRSGARGETTITPTQRPPDLHAIRRVAARLFTVRQTDLQGKTRRQSIVHARSVAMYVSRELSGESYAKIGSVYGGRDHTTVMHACRKIGEMISRDVETRGVVEKLKRILSSP